MIAQTALEFLVILAAVSAFGVFAIGTYSGLAHQQRSAYLSALNHSAGSNVPDSAHGAEAEPFLYASIQNVSYVNRSSALQVVVALPGSGRISSMEVAGAHGYGVFPGAYYNRSFSGIEILPFSIVPSSPGPLDIEISAKIEYGGRIATKNLTAQSFAVLQGPGTGPAQAGFTASISRHSESILYPLSNATPAYTARMWSHCSFLDFFYHQMSLQVQCRSASWYFFMFDAYCGQGPRTYCVELDPTNTSVRSIRQQQLYAYNVTLSLYNGSAALYADLSSARNASVLMGLDGNGHGNAEVESVSGTGAQPYLAYVALNTTGSSWLADSSAYGAYAQSLNNFISMMNYYNKTGGNVDAISEAISALNATTKRLIAPLPLEGMPACILSVQGAQPYYSCKPVSPLYYEIRASLDPSLAAPQLLSVQGSTINVT